MAPSLLLPLLLQAASPAGAAPQTINWTETTGIQWCSDGKSPDWTGYPKNPFGAGLDGVCPHTPASWSLDRVVQECEKLCAPAEPCLGFTLYPSAHQGGRASRNLTECCFRTGGVGQKPKWLPPAAITLAQISQMFVGVFIVCASSIFYKPWVVPGVA